MDCTSIHETVIRDIVDIIVDVKKSDEIGGILNRGASFKSVAQASSNLTLVFPIITSKNINIENASMVTKAMERKAVSIMQMLFSAICITNAPDAIAHIAKFHTNLKIDDALTVDGFIDAIDTFAIKNESCNITNVELYEQCKNDLRNLSNYLPDSISESSINDYKVYPQSMFGEPTIIKEDREQSQSKAAQELSSTQKNLQDLLRNQLLDSDVKKANELVPTMMIINFVSTDYASPIASQAIIGIKAKMYPVDSADIMSRIKLKSNDNNGLLKFIRATTREISFTRDFLFAIEKAQLDALSQSKKGSSSKLWKVLERRSLKSKLRRTLGQTNDASAVTTLVLSQEEVEYMKKNDNIDIENPGVIRGIMESYGFMSVCIVDESMEVAKFIFDTGNDIYEHVSFTHLERESNDGNSKKIINLMSKMSR